MTENADNRILRRLRTAYAQLLQEKSIDKITVTDLTEQADMARATFYLHYANMDDFRNDCFMYILTTSLQQCVVWFSAGRHGIQESCKKKNLLLSQSDRDMLAQMIAQQVYNEYGELFQFYDMKVAMQTFSQVWPDDFVEQNRGKLTVFFTGYVITAIHNLVNYNSHTMRTELQQVFEIWDYLFPDRPIA